MKSLAITTAAATAALLAVPLLTGHAMAAPATAQKVTETFTVPAGGTFTVVGHGFGHGHGLSQYGANGAAKQGLGHQQILAFYYPGTTLTRTSGSLRVLVSADTTRDVIVRATVGLKVKDLGNHKVRRLTKKGAKWYRLVPRGTKTVLQYKTRKWHRIRVLRGDGDFRASSNRLTLLLPGGEQRVYRGHLRPVTPPSGGAGRDTVNVVSLDDYVRGVVPAEMPASWNVQALQAQAVAARTYVMWSRAQYPARYYQICDTTACQVYRGAGAETASTNNAVAATAGQILTYGGQPAFTQFSASDGGWTSAGGKPYLPQQADPYDGYAAWSKPVDESTLEAKYPQVGDLTQLDVTSREGGGSEWGGRVLTVNLVGTAGTVTISGDAFRTALGLRSSWFNFRP